MPRPEAPAASPEPVVAFTWPMTHDSLVLGLAFDAGLLPLPQVPAEGQRILLEYESLPAVAAARFAGAVARGEAEDSAEGFAGFAAGQFERLVAFLGRHGVAEVVPPPGQPGSGDAPGPLVVPLAALRADPRGWARRIAAFLRPDLELDGEQVDSLSALAAIWAGPAPDLAGFRHNDPDLLSRLGRLRLPRQVVIETFAAVMGRPLEEAGILPLQVMASRDDLIRRLVNSKEYQLRQQRGGAVPAPASAPASSPASAPPPAPPVLVGLVLPEGADPLADLAASLDPAAVAGPDPGALERMTPRARAGLRLVRGPLPPGAADRLLPQGHVGLVVLAAPLPRLVRLFRARQATDPALTFGAFLDLCAATPELRALADNGQMRQIAMAAGEDGTAPASRLIRAAAELLFAPGTVFGLQERPAALTADLRARGLIPAGTPDPVADPEAPADSAELTADLTADLTLGQRDLLDLFTRWDHRLHDLCAACLSHPATQEPTR